MKYRAAELQGDALDYLVQCAERGETPLASVAAWAADNDSGYSPSTSWAQGGPIIERERMALIPQMKGSLNDPLKQFVWGAVCNEKAAGLIMYAEGYTVLQAAMRIYVSSKFGEEIELP